MFAKYVDFQEFVIPELLAQYGGQGYRVNRYNIPP